MDEREKDIIKCFVAEWFEGDMRLSGHLNYQDVIVFLAKHNIEDPGISDRLERFGSPVAFWKTSHP